MILLPILCLLRVLSMSILVKYTLLNTRKGNSLIQRWLISQSNCRNQWTIISKTKMGLEQGKREVYCALTSDMTYLKIESRKRYKFVLLLANSNPTRCSELRQVEKMKYISQEIKEVKCIKQILAIARLPNIIRRSKYTDT